MNAVNAPAEHGTSASRRGPGPARRERPAPADQQTPADQQAPTDQQASAGPKDPAPAQRGLPAAAVSRAVLGDPQFRMPVRPQLCRGLHIVRTDEGVIIDGAAERQHLRGSSAGALHTELFPLLDGSRDLVALARETGWSLPVVRKAVAAVYFAGLLEDADAAVEPALRPGPSEPAAVWMSRTLDCSRVFPHSSHVRRAAAEAVVRLAVRTGWREPLREALADLGITDVAAFEGGGDSPAGAVVVLDLSAPEIVADEVLEAYAQGGVRVLLADEHAGRVRVGPFVDPSATACLTCAVAAVRPLPDPLDWVAGSARTPRSVIAAGLVAEELRALLLRNESAASLGGQLDIDLAAFTTATYKLTPETDCPTCYPSAAAGPVGLPDDAPLHYEYAVGFPPRHLVNPKAHQHHFRPENVGLQYERLRYPNNPRIPLPDVSLAGLRDAESAAEPRPWPELLAAVLRFTAGLRTGQDRREDAEPGKVVRWAPTGGNLGSPHAFPLIQDCPGIPDGVYYYDAADHALTAMHPHTGHLTEAVAHAGAEAEGPRVHLLYAAETGRVARKYGAFSYRVGTLDTGCALAQLAVVARQTGLACRLLDPAPWQPYRERLLGAGGPPLLTAAVHLTSDRSGSCR
ncbi:hypothetical protein [Streptomyces sp. NPDC048639]|uniref:hypothetical protein n=1 Tax=Streptomyces sp. NPDC048639 TaxID=3365581 RepID=UPI00371F4AC6